MENIIPEFVPNPNNPHQIHWFDISFEDAIKDVGLSRESRQELENKWKSSVSDGRAHYSNREFKRSKRIEFQSAISEYYTIEYIVLILAKHNLCRLSLLSNDLLRLIIDYTYFGTLGCYIPYFVKQQNDLLSITNYFNHNYNKKVRIVTRIRPIFQYEIDLNNYESVIKKNNDDHLINLHDGRIARSGRKLLMNNKTYFFDKVYDNSTSNDDIFQCEIVSLLNNCINSAIKASTIILYGQTGCGKTYTMSNILHDLAKKMYNKHIEILFCELHGKKCYDLFDKRKEIKLLSTSDGEVIMKNSKAHKLYIDNEYLFINTIEEALKLRTFEPTERNPISSRSHAVFVLKYSNGNDEIISNKLTIVDLAGSERKHDTITMTRDMQQESIDINFSLMALKDCFRGYYNNLNKNNRKVFINYRASLLTRILRDCFKTDNDEINDHCTTIIGCISPSASDVIHSINTLDHISLMKHDLSKYNHEVTIEIPSNSNMACSYIPVEKWSNENLNSWLSIAEKGRFANLVLPNSLDGNAILSLNIHKLSALCEGILREARNNNEGSSWIIEGEHNENSVNVLGKALFSAIRREQKQNIHVIQNNIKI